MQTPKILRIAVKKIRFLLRVGINLNYPLQVEDGGHLCEASKLVSNGPRGHGGEICHERAKLFIKLQPSELQQKDQRKEKNTCEYITVWEKPAKGKHSSGIINKSLLEAVPQLGATWWLSSAPHPAERAFQDSLLQLH